MSSQKARSKSLIKYIFGDDYEWKDEKSKTIGINFILNYVFMYNQNAPNVLIQRYNLDDNGFKTLNEISLTIKRRQRDPIKNGVYVRKEMVRQILQKSLSILQTTKIRKYLNEFINYSE